MIDVTDIFMDTRDPDLIMKDDVPITDEEWIKDTFMVSSLDLPDEYAINRFMSTVDSKFTDTSMGGNISINVYPQFTRYSDIRLSGIVNGRNQVSPADMSGNYGMGRYYGEAIDDNSTNVYFEFGVPEFNNILFFFLSAVDYKKAVIANSGRSPFFYNAGKLFGYGAMVIAFPILTPMIIIGKFLFETAMDIFASPGRFENYYLKPTMFMYWSTVNSIVTMMATELGILSPIFMDKGSKDKYGTPLELSQTDLDAVRELMPGLITSGNVINVHAMVTKAQKMYAKVVANRNKALLKLESTPIINEDLRTGTTEIEVPPTNDLWEKLKPYLERDKGYTIGKKPKDLKELIAELKNEAKTSIEKLFEKDNEGRYERVREEDSPGWISNSFKTAVAVINEGARYAVFRVDSIGSQTESFSNSVTTVDMGDKINSLGQKWRSMKFNLGGGEIPGLTDVVKSAVDFAIGATDGLTLGLSNVVAGFLSGANVEMSKRWQDSSASFPSLSFKMNLVSPSAHPIAQLQNLYIPLASILAGVLPLSTGPKSYTSPFICSVFVRGQQKISLGMITSVSVTRGTSNLPYNKTRRPLALEVSFTVTDFSEVISAPVADSLLSSGSLMYDDESGLSRYIQALCGRNLYSSTHVWDKAKIKLSRFFQDVDLKLTPEFWGAKVGDVLASTTLFSIIGSKKAVNYSELY